MSDTENAVHSDESQLVSVLGEYMDRLDDGEQVDREQFIAQHPALADALRAHFEDSDFVEQMAGPTVADELQNSAAADTSLAMAIQETKATPSAGTDESKHALPKIFGRYRVEKTLGEGAMGAVYLAEDTELKRKVALKVPKFNANDEPEIIERFYREAQSVARLHHRNICPVFDIGEIDGVRFISMAYVDGQPLSSFIHAEKSLPEKQAVLVIRKLALALQEAHSHNIIHRDLKPSNIMIDKQSEPVILDFGLARSLSNPQDSRLTRDGMIVGTPAYMSPEQIKADVDRIGPATDIYCLGVVMYELLTGRLPFTGSMTEVLALGLREPPPKPSALRPQIDTRLDSLCFSMMSKEIGERPTSMLAVADSLSHILKSPSGGSSQQPAAAVAAKASSGSSTPDRSPSTDSEEFDPYHKWLGIPLREQPPNYYRLLAIELFEDDLDVIDSAATGRMTHIRQFSNGPNAAVSQTLLNEISNAQICLLDPEKKSAYDAQLKTELDAKVAAVETVTDETSPKGKQAGDSKLNQQIRKLDKQKTQIESLIEKCEFATAISALEKMAAVKNPKLAKYAKWAKQQIPRAKRGTKEMRESSAAVYRTATDLFDRNDYEEAAEMLQQIPSKYRNGEFSELLQECLDLQEEIVSLQEDIDHAESINKYDDLQPTVERLLEIKPNDRRAKKLLKELKTYGKGGGMRLGGRGDHRFDAAGNTSNPVKVALLVAIPLALFAAVSWATVIYIRSNNKTIKIEIDDPSAKVLIDNETVEITGSGDTIKLKVGMHDLVVERGDTKVITRQFEVVKGKNQVLRITLADANVASSQTPNVPGRQPPAAGDVSIADRMKQIPGLVAYYPLDEKSGRVAQDASGNGHFGKIQGNVEFTSGKVGNAMKFDKEALVDLGKPIDVSRSTPFSIGAWIQPNETGRMSIVSRHPSTRELPGHGLLLARGGTLYGRLSHVWGKNAIQVATKEPLDLKSWHHVMMTYDGSSKAAGLNLFVDGKQQPVNILQDSLTDSIATDSPITISRNVNDLSAGVDEVAIFNRVLRADEVAQIVRWASDTKTSAPSGPAPNLGKFAAVRMPGVEPWPVEEGMPAWLPKRYYYTNIPKFVATGFEYLQGKNVKVNTTRFDVLSDGIVYLVLSGRGKGSGNSSGGGGEWQKSITTPEQIATAGWKPIGTLDINGHPQSTIYERLCKKGESFTYSWEKYIAPALIVPKASSTSTAGSGTQTLNGHTDRVTGVAFSPDGKQFVSSSFDKTIKIWDTTTGQEIRTLSGHGSQVRSVAFSPDGKQIVSGSNDFMVKVWDAATGREQSNLKGHTAYIRSVAFSPDGQQIASGSDDKTIKIWNASTGQEIKTLSGHTHSVISVAFSPNGQQIASACGDMTIKVWDSATGRELRTLDGHKHFVTGLAFSPDGKEIVSCSSDQSIKIWDATTGQEKQTLKGHIGSILSVAYRPDGKQFVSTGQDNRLIVWDASTGQELQTLAGHTGGVWSVNFSPDGKQVVSGSDDKTIVLWDLTATTAPSTPTAPNTTTLPIATANRRAAEWVLSVGGIVFCRSVDTPGNQNGTRIDKAGDLPKGPFDVRIIQLGRKQVSDADLDQLGGLTQLYQLELQETEVTGTGFSHLTDLPSLTNLVLSNSALTDEGLSHVAKLRNLTHLAASGIGCRDEGIRHLAGHPALANLGLSSKNMTDDCAVYLKQIPNLADLSLQNAPITDAALVHLSEMKSLVNLRLSNTKISDAGLKHLSEMEGLILLDIRNTTITDAGMVHLEQMKDLNSLLIQDAPVTDDGLQHLAELENLTFIELSNLSITDAGLKHLANMKNLARLDLRRLKLTDAGLMHFKALPKLSQVQAQGTPFSDQGVQAVNAARRTAGLPELRVAR